ncbi:hypothetical protein GJ496_003461 [Pomphorhynchus laevis]|nr:hypothetical protein GJ496_003461 [Pomphorhynchus laevis]
MEDLMVVAKYDYSATEPKEMSFKKGDKFILVDDRQHWWLVQRLDGDQLGEYKDQWIKWKYNAKRFILTNSHSLERSIIYTYPNIKSVLGRSLEDGRHLTHIAAEVGDVVALQLLLWASPNKDNSDKDWTQSRNNNSEKLVVDLALPKTKFGTVLKVVKQVNDFIDNFKVLHTSMPSSLACQVHFLFSVD